MSLYGRNGRGIECPAARQLQARLSGPRSGPLGINVKAVVDGINRKTAEFNGMQVPVTVTVDDKRNFTIEVGIPPTAALIKKRPVSRGVRLSRVVRW